MDACKVKRGFCRFEFGLGVGTRDELLEEGFGEVIVARMYLT